MNLRKSGIIKQAFKEDGAAVTPAFLKKVFARRKTYNTSRPFTIKKAVLREFAHIIPDEEAFMRLFLEFLQQEFGAKGTVEIVRKRQKLIF